MPTKPVVATVAPSGMRATASAAVMILLAFLGVAFIVNGAYRTGALYRSRRGLCVAN